MKPCLHPELEDLVGALPTSARQKQRLLKFVRIALLRVAPHLASGAATDVRPQDLRTLFLALDLFVFGARYRTAFEMAPPVAFAWRLSDEEDGPDCRLEYLSARGDACCDCEETLLEFHVAPARVVHPGAKTGPCALLDGLADAMLRLMTLAACLVVEDDTARGLALASRLSNRLRLEA